MTFGAGMPARCGGAKALRSDRKDICGSFEPKRRALRPKREWRLDACCAAFVQGSRGIGQERLREQVPRIGSSGG